MSALVSGVADAGAEVAPVPENLVDKVWGQDQPPRPENPVVPLEREFTGERDEGLKLRSNGFGRNGCILLFNHFGHIH